jgi:hypothetical protein
MKARTAGKRREVLKRRNKAPRTRVSGLLLAALIVAGFGVRLLASRGDLWLDEILSVEIARSIPHPADLVRDVYARVDNNHLLNTFWLQIARDSASPILQRIHSVVAGTLAIPLAWVFARRWGQSAPGFAGVLFAGSFVAINYGSEARGYGMLIAFGLAAIVAIDRALRRPSAATTLVFWTACVLGTLSHALFLEFFVAVGVWTLARLFRDSTRGWWTAAAFMLQYYLLPVLAVVGLYVTFFRHLRILGANPSVPAEVIAQTAAFVFGLPRDPFAAYASLAVAAAIIALGMGTLWRHDDAWTLAGMLCLGAPLLMMVLAPPEILPRYFIVPATGLLLLTAMLLGRLYDRGGPNRAAAVVVLLLVLGLNSRDTARLLKDGRGQYRRALTDIASNTPGDVLRIGGDHTFREKTVIDYHRSAVPSKRVEYVSGDGPEAGVPDWVVTHSFDVEQDPAAPAVVDQTGRQYKLFGVYPSGPLSGWHWYVYRH